MTAIREQILEGLKTKLATIPSSTVSRATRSRFEGTGLFITLWDGEEEASLDDYSNQAYTFAVVVLVQLPVDSNNPSTLASSTVSTVISKIIDTDPELGGLADSVDYAGFVPSYPEDGQNYLSLAITFTISYTTVFGNYETQPV